MGTRGRARESEPAQRQQLLPRVQRVFLWLLVASIGASTASWVFAPQVPREQSWTVLPAGVLIAAVAWWRQRRGSTPLVLDLVSAASVGCFIWAVGAGPASGVLYVVMIHRALYGRLASVSVALGLQLAALVGGTLVAGVPLAQAALPSNIPGVVCVAGAFHLLATGLRRYETGSEARFQALVRGSSDAILLVDGDTRVTYASPALSRVFGPVAGAAEPARLLDWVADEDREHLAGRIGALLTDGGGATTTTCRVADPAGRQRHVEMTIQNALADPGVQGLIVNAHDVTARVELADQLRHQALHDPLTGLANRVLFGELLERALARRGGVAAVLLVDLDGFKAVNDTLGHAAGDQLLVEVAGRLRSCVRPEDSVARLGGDEFAVLLTGTRAAAAVARAVGERLLAGIGGPVRLDAGGVRPAASIGAALSGPVAEGRTAAEAAEELLRCADLALYQAKAGGRNRLEVYRPDLHAETLDRLALETDLRVAVDRRELLLHYQPIFTLDTGELVGVEALLRWSHPTRGVVSPLDFIPIAEATGLIHPIGTWVLGEACRRVASWQRQDLTAAPLRLSVNLSARQFDDPAMAVLVQQIMAASGLAPGTLTLELTESVLASDPVAVLKQLQEIRALGVRVSIDDFGTGYSALSYLQRYPVDEIKIDSSFVERLDAGDPDASTLTSAIIAMGQALRLDTVAEGIETEAQQAQLTALGCQLGQGYRLSRPLNERALETLLGTDRQVRQVR